MKGVIYMTKKERKKKKRQILQLRKLAKAVEASHNKFYWVAYKSLKDIEASHNKFYWAAYKSLKVIGARYSKQLCPTKRYRLRRFKEIVIPYPNRKKRIISSSAPYRMSVRSDYAKSFLNIFRMDIPEIVTTNAKDRALSDEEIETLKKVFP